MSPDIDEKAIRSSDPREMVLLIARAKSAALKERLTDPAILITCDQVISCDGQVREKPETTERAYQYLESYATHPAECICGVVVC